MATWTNNGNRDESGNKELSRYSPRDLTDNRDFGRELHDIESNQTLSMLDKYRAKKQLMRAVYTAKQQEISHHLDSFENYLLARKDVEARAITVEAQKAIMVIEKEQLAMMKDLGLTNAGEISDTLIQVGTMLTAKLEEIEASAMLPDIKALTLNNVRRVWEKTNQRIMESVDTYMDELYEKEKRR